MAYNRRQAAAFLTETESALFNCSLSDSCKDLSLADLRSRIKRTRTLRDKFRDLLQRQKLATRARTGNKGGPSGRANERTDNKATAFDEALTRFEAELQRREKRAAAASAKQPPKAAAAKKKHVPGKTAATKSVATKPAAKRSAPGKVAATVVLRRALDRKQAALEEAVADPQATPGKKPARSPKAPVSDLRATPPDVRAAAVSSRLADSGLSRTQGHISSQVRRNEAKGNKRG